VRSSQSPNKTAPVVLWWQEVDAISRIQNDENDDLILNSGKTHTGFAAYPRKRGCP
jgi:hypothetical protein